MIPRGLYRREQVHVLLVAFACSLATAVMVVSLVMMVVMTAARAAAAFAAVLVYDCCVCGRWMGVWIVVIGWRVGSDPVLVAHNGLSLVVHSLCSAV